MTDFVEEDPFDPALAEQVEAQKRQRDAQADDALLQYVRRIKLAYTRVFSGTGDKADADVVLHDLAWFCKAFETPFDPNNARVEAHLIGRQSVFLRLKEYALLDVDTIMRRYMETQGK